MNNLYELKHDTTRGIVITTRGEELPIKEHNGWRYVNYQGTKVGVSKLAVKHYTNNNDPVDDYIFNGGFTTYPCPAMDYWIYRHRLLNRITDAAYAAKFGVVKQKKLVTL
jgi:phage pi2 protein 07